MEHITSIAQMQDRSDEVRSSGRRIAVVPTMGSLHEGHLSLVNLAQRYSEVVIMTIFVNPKQFGPNEDFAAYPRNLERDRQLAASVGTSILFTPPTEEMYSSNYLSYVEVEKMTTVLEGKFRPTHFRGVTTVVTKLFNITKPHIAVFGQKDAQQTAVIQQMVKDLDFDIEVIVAPIVRESDGLAMSSRNIYLSSTERQDAIILYQSLQFGERLIGSGERNGHTIISKMKELVASKRSAQVDYISIADHHTLQDVSMITAGSEVLLSLAVRIGKTRLIDNVRVKV